MKSSASLTQEAQSHSLLINLLFIVISLLVIVPFTLVVITSLSSEQSILNNGYRFIPDQFSLDAYALVFKSPQVIIRAYGVTIAVTALGTLLSLALTALTGYVISRRDFALNRHATVYIFFTMLFSGGLVPFYILMTQYLHLKDTIWALVIPSLLNPFYIMIMKGFLSKIPFELIESGKVDGASELRIFVAMIIPLSTPGLATLGLLISFNYWNEWFNALLFIDKPGLVTLQLLLVRMMNSIEYLTSNMQFVRQLGIDVSNMPKYSTRMAMALVAAGPILPVFPFFQRYFVAGLTVGSLKG